MIKNGEYEGLVEGFGTDGEGIIKKEGATVFVPFCLVGECVRFKLLKLKGNVGYGKLLSVLSPSPQRVAPPCPVFGKCGGCDLQHMNYAAQLDLKRKSVAAALAKIGGIEAEVSPAVPSDEIYGYRNKISLPIGVDGAGNTIVGFYARRTHRIVPVQTCAIHSGWAAGVISAVSAFIGASGLKGYDEVSGKGELRHLVVREVKGAFIVALVAAKVVDASAFIDGLKKIFGKFTLLLNINSNPANAIFGGEWRVLYGDGFFAAEEFGIKYSAGANTFLQVNDGVRGKLYSRVIEEVPENAVVVDAYSGGGMLTAMLAKKCGKAFGIEVVAEASRCADELKAANGLEGRMFNICGKVEEKIGDVLSASEGARVIVCDPPRKGMERSVVRAIAEADAEKIILISCNPATLARDLGLLLNTLEEKDGALVKNPSPQSRYSVTGITPFDMFPQTKWCETLVVLKRK